MRTCVRCGIEFKSLAYNEYCYDCQEVEPELVRDGGENGTLSKAETNALVTKLNGFGFTDPEIAQELGFKNRQQAWYIRKKRLGLPTVYRPEKYLWKDREAQLKHVRTMVFYRTDEQTKRGKKIDRGRKGFATYNSQAS